MLYLHVRGCIFVAACGLSDNIVYNLLDNIVEYDTSVYVGTQ